MKIAGTVVLYNPDKDVIENIQTYLPFLDKLYVMDNSTKPLENLPQIKKLPKVEYISLNGNQGIAKALKIATEKAVEEKIDYILSMDQDSKFPTEDFKYVSLLLKNLDYSIVGAVAVNNDAATDKIDENKECVIEKPWVITSGCFMSTKAYASTNGYNEDLFVDGADTDICYKIAKAGFKFYMLKNVCLVHHVGDECKCFKIFNRKIMSLFTHSPIRYYYQFRNFEFLSRKYKDIFKSEYKLFKYKLPIKVLFLENNKCKVFKMIKKGIRDGKKGILGHYKEK